MSRKSKAAEFLDDIYDINVTGRNVLVTEAMKNYAIDKISKIDRFNGRVIDVQVVMDIQRYDHRVDIIMKVANQKIKVSAHTTDMYASIDKAINRLLEQIRKFKEKTKDHHTLAHAEVAMNVNIYSTLDDILDLNEEIEAENRRVLETRLTPHEIVKSETRPLKTLTVGEAIVKMELSADGFMIFRCEEDQKLKVIYKRDDGNFGIIEPEK
jgi:putative sigma-54 modulation protein